MTVCPWFFIELGGIGKARLNMASLRVSIEKSNKMIVTIEVIVIKSIRRVYSNANQNIFFQSILLNMLTSEYITIENPLDEGEFSFPLLV